MELRRLRAAHKSPVCQSLSHSSSKRKVFILFSLGFSVVTAVTGHLLIFNTPHRCTWPLPYNYPVASVTPSVCRHPPWLIWRCQCAVTEHRTVEICSWLALAPWWEPLQHASGQPHVSAPSFSSPDTQQALNSGTKCVNLKFQGAGFKPDGAQPGAMMPGLLSQSWHPLAARISPSPPVK
jgi:hypothetical protein